MNALAGVQGDFGFTFQIDGMKSGDSVELYALMDAKLHLLDTAVAPHPTIETSFIRQLDRVRDIAEDPSSVAIAVWESSHNPVGRAKVLYDIARTKRQAAVFAYSFSEFGGKIWAPLADSDMGVVTVPWATREPYHRLLAEAGILFSTVWLCKPRYPTFVMAAHIARPDARLILDLDDNEEEFSRSDASARKAYGLPGIGLSRALMGRVPARTVASRSLQTDFGGHLVRHARAQEESVVTRMPALEQDSPCRIGFVGTVRPHKNLLAAAKAVAVTRWLTGVDVELHVMGDVSPDSLRDELVQNGAVVGDVVPSGDLARVLADMDCVLTGFPHSDEAHAPITRYQISSKIGDALASGVPALVPHGESVDDLADMPGVYLFDEGSFADRLMDALRETAPVRLAPEFTLENAYAAFAAAETDAAAGPRAAAALELARAEGPDLNVVVPRPPVQDRNLLLLWKQVDAGMYGRRVDQIARAYKRAHPGARVVVLEFADDWRVNNLAERKLDHLSDARHLFEMLAVKRAGGLIDPDGVEYRALKLDGPSHVRMQFEEFLVNQGMTPANTTAIIFPIVPFFERISSVIDAFPTIADVVDNQFSWSQTNAESNVNYALQYHTLLRQADRICFNSQLNLDQFLANGMVAGDSDVSLIPNWYALPAGFAAGVAGSETSRPSLVYTGNMNSRVDWGTLLRAANLPLGPWVHLVGTAERTPTNALRRVLDHERVAYFGPQREAATLRILGTSTLAVMPHTVDGYSTFMNPLKLAMYRAVGLPVVSSNVPGIPAADSLLHVAANRGDFVRTVGRLLRDPDSLNGSIVGDPRSVSNPQVEPQMTSYVKMIDTLMPTGRTPQEKSAWLPRKSR